MSIRKLCSVAMLGIAALLLLKIFTVQLSGPSSPRPGARARMLPDRSLSPMRQPSGHSGRQSVLPVQFRNPKDLGVGKLLVASRGLGDPNFAGTVVLLVHYDEDGVVGLILNRRTDFPLSRALDFKAAKERSDRLYVGGPVGTSSVFGLLQSTDKPEGAEHVVGAIYMISSKTLFEQTISKKPDADVFRVYLGYAGWNPQQLRQEVALGAWFVFPGDVTTVFDPHRDSLWPRMIHKTELELAQAIFD